METQQLYDVAVSTGNPLYVVNIVILRFGISKKECLELLQEKTIAPKGLVFGKPNNNHFIDMKNIYRIEVYNH